MAKRIAAAILLCAVMVMIAAAPLAMSAEPHHVVKGAQGPRASAVTWEYVAPDYGVWTGHIVNTGLRSLVVDVYENQSGVLVSALHQRIHFATYNAYPNGEVNTSGVVVSPHQSWTIVVTPNGPKDSYCDVWDVFTPAIKPTAVIDVTSQIGLTVAVTGFNSTDDGTIVSYDWNFGDLTPVVSGMGATHTYAADGTYDITLVVTDNDGLTGTDIESVVVKDSPPTASFTVEVIGLTVNVNAALSSDDIGIMSYVWNWGDGTLDGSGVTATHTYSRPTEASPGAPSIASAIVPQGDTYPPYLVWGYTLDALGNPYECDITVTNLRTGEVGYTNSYQAPGWPLDGYFELDIQHALPSAFLPGDQIKVDAVSVSGIMSGSAQSAVPNPAGGSLHIDVTVTGAPPMPFDRTITLTVTDIKGQTSVATMTVTLYP